MSAVALFLLLLLLGFLLEVWVMALAFCPGSSLEDGLLKGGVTKKPGIVDT